MLLDSSLLSNARSPASSACPEIQIWPVFGSHSGFPLLTSNLYYHPFERSKPSPFPKILQIFYHPPTVMDCLGDFCLACDKQTNGAPFCSQACRLAELDQSSSSSEPTSPIYPRHRTSQRSLHSVTAAFQLPPAIDFSSYRRERMVQTPASQAKSSTSSYHTANKATTAPSHSSRTSYLTPSSSQTSLSSLRTIHTSPGGISEQAWDELRNYASNFDQIRTLRRQMSTL